MMSPKITVVVPVRDEEASICQLLEALASQTLSPHEILFVDSGSRDATRSIIESAPLPSCHVVPLPRTSRIGAARNVGVLLAQSPIIATTDAGAHPHCDWLRELVRPILMGTSEFVYGTVAPWGSSPKEIFLSELLLPAPGLHRAGAGVNTAYTVAAWRAAGGYPEAPISGEDLGFVERMTKAGLSATYVPSATVYWHGPGSVAGHLLQYLRYAEGDADRHRNLPVHVLRIAAYGSVLLGARHRLAALPALIQLGLRTRSRVARLRAHASTRPIPYTMRFELSVPLLLLMGDLAKIVGFVKGWTSRSR